MKTHIYKAQITWTGNNGKGTESYKAYNRNHTISINGKYDDILASSDPSFLGDTARYNPEELLLSSISACHMLWYLHLCSINKITVNSYVDNAYGEMEELENGSGRFTKVILKPTVNINEIELKEKATSLHHKANEMCFIANSLNFPIEHLPKII